jgi:hypothetical protein
LFNQGDGFSEVVAISVRNVAGGVEEDHGISVFLESLEDSAAEGMNLFLGRGPGSVNPRATAKCDRIVLVCDPTRLEDLFVGGGRWLGARGGSDGIKGAGSNGKGREGGRHFLGTVGCRLGGFGNRGGFTGRLGLGVVSKARGGWGRVGGHDGTAKLDNGGKRT